MTGELGLEEWLDAVSSGDGYYYCCAQDHASLPPRRCCPDCGGDLGREPLPTDGELLTHTISHVSTPKFGDETPFAIGIASFGPVSITGRLPVSDSETFERGLSVKLDVEDSDATGERIPVLRPNR